MSRRPPPPPPPSRDSSRLGGSPSRHGASPRSSEHDASMVKWIALAVVACAFLLLLLVAIGAAIFIWTRNQEMQPPAQSVDKPIDSMNSKIPPTEKKEEKETEEETKDDEPKPKPKGDEKSETKTDETPKPRKSGSDAPNDGKEAAREGGAVEDAGMTGGTGDGGGEQKVEGAPKEAGGNGLDREEPSDDGANDSTAGPNGAKSAASGNRGSGPLALGDAPPIEKPESVKPATGELFGIRAKGDRFVYVIDCSTYMTRKRFERVRDELLSALDDLEDTQSFFVILYSDDVFPMYYPTVDVAPALVSPSSAELAKVKKWLTDYYTWGSPDPLPAIQRAFAMKPDAVFLLAGGKFDVADIDAITQSNSAKIPIHGIAIFDEEAKSLVRAIARKNDGVSKFIPD